MEWMQKRGVEVFLLAHTNHVSNHPMVVPPERFQLGGKINEVARKFQVDVVHIHWLILLEWFHIGELTAGLDFPLTVRGHSFDFTVERTFRVSSFDSVHKIWLFPHYAEKAAHVSTKVASLSACYDFGVFQPGLSDGKVVRAAAGLEDKDIEGFLSVARLCPERRFELIVTRAFKPEGYPERLARLASDNVTVKVNLQREEVAKAMSTASFCLRGSDESAHQFGMPVSVIEAMGCGVTPILPDLPAAHSYAGSAAFYYKTMEEAVEILRVGAARKEEAIEMAKRYKTDVVLPEVISEWERLAR